MLSSPKHKFNDKVWFLINPYQEPDKYCSGHVQFVVVEHSIWYTIRVDDSLSEFVRVENDVIGDGEYKLRQLYE
jgi:hypothetical protein